MKNTSVILASCVTFLFSATMSASAVPVTFQVNLEYQVTNDTPTFDPNNDTVEIRGDFNNNNWNSGFPLVRVGNTTSYTNTYDITSPSPGGLVQFKFHTYGPSEDNWESLQSYIYTNGYGNRAFILSSSAQTLPPVYFSDQWGGTILLTVQVDMTPQILVGNFIPGDDTLEVRGSWDGFSSGVTLTNNPASAISNIYAMTFNIASPAPGGLGAYKFHHYGSSPDTWESIDNRIFLATNPATLLPLVYFNNQDTNDLLFADTLVTFSVNMTNAVGIDFYVFNPGEDPVYINGDFLGWWAWDFPPPPSQCQMFPVGNSEVYTNTLLIPKGNPVALTYKYSIAEYGNDAADNEAGFEENHVRYIRNTGSCVLPMDTFGTQLVEPVVGSLNIGQPVSGNVNVTWDGHIGIHLQTSTNLALGVWNDLPATEGFNSTNYPVGAGTTFFRLVKP
ncbi:MAG: hypothetical protein ABSC89_04340 [Verrucomicrobiota bacterium]|jgi:hypothetical protein